MKLIKFYSSLLKSLNSPTLIKFKPRLILLSLLKQQIRFCHSSKMPQKIMLLQQITNAALIPLIMAKMSKITKNLKIVVQQKNLKK